MGNHAKFCGDQLNSIFQNGSRLPSWIFKIGNLNSPQG